MEDILRTKVSIPPLGPHTLVRAELTTKLNNDLATREGFLRKLTLVCAPAGFGKTTTVRAWLAGKENRTAWYSLDEDDNNPQRFWRYIIAALQNLARGIGKGSLAILRSDTLATDSELNVKSILTPLLNDLYNLEEPGYLVIDDYHFIDSHHIHQGMAFLIENLPPGLHVAITTRSDPPWPLFRWRAKGEISEMRLRELRFSEREAELFLQTKGRTLGEPQLHALYDKTEGWVTGLLLAAHSISSGSKLGNSIGVPHSGHSYVLSFLGDEVFAQQPSDIQEFLMKTSVLGRFSAALCEAVTGHLGAEEKLATLVRDNIFLVALDSEGKWYRYHHLFAELLSYQLRKHFSNQIPRLHARACSWLLEGGHIEEAVRHALLGGELEVAATILHDNYEQLLHEGAVRNLFTWQEALPESMLLKYPRLLAYRALYHLVVGQKDKVAGCLTLASTLAYTSEAEQREYLGLLATITAYYNIYEHNLKCALESAEDALQHLSPRSYFWRIAVATLCGDALLFSGNPQKSHTYYLDAYQLSQRSGIRALDLPTGFKLAVNLCYLGRLKEAEAIVNDTLKVARDEGLSRISKAASLWGVLGDIQREQGNHADAERCIERALLLSDSESPIKAWNYLYKAAFHYSKGDFSAAFKAVNQAKTQGEGVHLPAYIGFYVSLWEARVLVQLGEVSRAREVLLGVGVADDLPINSGYESGYLILCRSHLTGCGADGQPLERILREVGERVAANGNAMLALECLLLTSRMHHKRDRHPLAEESLYNALKSAIRSGYRQIFIDEGPDLQAVYSTLRNRLQDSLTLEDKVILRYGDSVFHVGPASAAPELDMKTTASALADKHCIEELSPRELEVLTLIGQGLSNSDICSTLFLSMGTVKWHTSNIYAKLGVRSRTEAVAVSRRLGLLK